ncbi:hypothetical protein [Paenibacillus massiliensis]|uniref:hypothetical protein n=1 Tax=Paenibacillus massiliensis TaxID=225917 RepID=UPI000470D495|nr:hypothetical protein [Paenibacillus massiliensis]
MMDMKRAWLITVREMTMGRWTIPMSILFSLYLGFTTSMVMAIQFNGEDVALSPIMDFLILFLLPFLGFLFNRRSFMYLQEDSYTTMLAYYRTLPIPSRIVVMSRIQQMFVAFGMNGLVYFSCLFVLAGDLQSNFSIAFFLTFALTWGAYGIIVHCIYIFMEMTSSGRKYFWNSLIAGIPIVILVIVVSMMGSSVVSWVTRISRDFTLASPLLWVLLIGAIASVWTSARLTLRSLLRRDLA